jgi:hypothetical protein
MANNNDIMQNPTRVIPVAFSTSTTVSDVVNFSTSIDVDGRGGGYSQPRRIDFLSTFITSDVQIRISTDGVTFGDLKYFDGNDLSTGVTTILGVSPGNYISLPAPIFDSIVYMQLTCITAQTQSTTPALNAVGTTLYDNGA